jgi:hypothetical protein
VRQRLPRGDPPRGVVLKHPPHQVDAGRLERREDLGQVLRRPARELVPVAQLGDARPRGLVGRAEQLEDVQQLLQLRVPREQRLLADELAEDARDAPDVDSRRVVCSAEQDLGGAVPQRHDLVGVGLDRHG